MSMEKIKVEVMGLVEMYQDNKKNVNQLNEANKVLKGEIINLLQKAGTKELFNDTYVVKYNIPKFFDVGMFKMDNPELAKQFITEETTTKTKDVVNKKMLLKQYPAIYNQYMLSDTPRLTVKGGF